ncbi:MAG: 16S rRNA (cytidine(1402)-2'-O)-methyltransferase [Pseudomonadota bacterium]
MNRNSVGILYIVATPIGNLQDMSLRAIEILKSVSGIVAEDTRHSQPLLQHFSIATPVAALHEHNERERTQQLLQRLQKGEDIALISDAGTPLISDPGYYLVREAQQAGIRVVPIPGACAAIAALSAAGLATDRFIFEGFLPAKAGARDHRLTALRNESRTLVFYEAPHRVLDLLQAMLTIYGPERRVVIARELTKLFETIKSAPLQELVEWVSADPNQQRGEIVILVEGLKEIADSTLLEMQRILTTLLTDLPLKQAVELTAKITGIKKNEVYALALEIKQQRHD